MWVAGRLGLIRYCGNDNPQIYERKDGESLASFDILEDSRGVVWLCTIEGLFYTKGNYLERYQFGDSVTTNQRFRRVIEDHENNLWVLSKKSLFQLRRNGHGFMVRHIKIDLELSEIIETPGRDIWVGTNAGICVVEADSLRLIVNTSSAPGHIGKVRGLFKGPHNELYFLDNFLNQVDAQLKFKEIANVAIGTVDGDFADMRGGKFVIAESTDSLNIYHNGKPVFRFSSGGLNLSIWRSLHIDKEGNIWAGHQRGLVKFTPSPIRKLPLIPASSGINPLSVIFLKTLTDSTLMLVTDKYQFVNVNLNTWKFNSYGWEKPITENLPGILNQDTRMVDLVLRGDTAYVLNAMYEIFGIDIRRKDAFSFTKNTDYFREIFSFLEDNDTLWVAGTEAFGRITGGRLQYFNSPLLASNFIVGIERFPRSDSVLLFSKSGMLYYSGGKIGKVANTAWPWGGKINNAFRESDSSILAFVDGHGIYRIINSGGLKFKPILTTENSTYDFKNLFGFSNPGGRVFVKLNNASFFYLLSNYKEKYYLRYSPFSDHIGNHLTLGIDPSYDWMHTLYWVNKGNIYSLNYADSNLFEKKRTLAITNITVPGYEQPDTVAAAHKNGLVLKYAHNTVSFGFSEIDFNSSTAKTYEYYLEGYDKNPFQNTTTSNEAIYRNLPAGTYNFHVRSRHNYDERGNLVEAVFYFRILPPWYQTWWAYLLWTTMATGIILWIVKWRVDITRKKEGFKKMVVDNELKALRAQINPHFIQNTFDLMAHGIHKGDTGESISIIHKVSAYLRQVLYKSEKSTITLEDELEYTEDYLKMQQMVRPGLFEYRFHVSDEVDTFGIRVPSMLLQPIVENCIKHGFRQIRSGGMIEIAVRQSGDNLHFQIKDDGAGIVGKGIDPENSKGLQLTYKRLMLMFPGRVQKNLVVDLKDRADGIRGAEYNILMPLAS
ncbi:MAG: histidine kinase [Ferruginibacter sp.]